MFTTQCVSRDTFHMSHVTYQVSGVTCHVPHVTSNSWTVRARELKFCEKVHLIPPVTCHMSHGTCHLFFSLSFFRHSGEASQCRVCYQRGLPRLVWILLHFWFATLAPCLELSHDWNSIYQSFSLQVCPSLLPRGEDHHSTLTLGRSAVCSM